MRRRAVEILTELNVSIRGALKELGNRKIPWRGIVVHADIGACQFASSFALYSYGH